MTTFFWKEHAKNGWLSNWSPHPITVNSIYFQTVEHYIMYRKAILFNDPIATSILSASTPAVAKAMGRKVKNFDESVWDANIHIIIDTGLLAKVKQHPSIRALLKATGTSIIAEASPYDAKWGIGMSESSPYINDRSKWGQNLLGDTWMIVRATL